MVFPSVALASAPALSNSRATASNVVGGQSVGATPCFDAAATNTFILEVEHTDTIFVGVARKAAIHAGLASKGEESPDVVAYYGGFSGEAGNAAWNQLSFPISTDDLVIGCHPAPTDDECSTTSSTSADCVHHCVRSAAAAASTAERCSRSTA